MGKIISNNNRTWTYKAQVATKFVAWQIFTRPLLVVENLFVFYEKFAFDSVPYLQLANMKPTVDTTPPRTFYLVHNRPKRNFVRKKYSHWFSFLAAQFMKETSERIERENLRLIKRMEEIMHLKGFVDNQNRYKPKRWFDLLLTIFPHQISLNEDFRRREIQRIMRDNEDLVRRMNQRLMTYRGPRWEESWAHTLTYLDNISKYPSFLKKVQYHFDE